MHTIREGVGTMETKEELHVPQNMSAQEIGEFYRGVEERILHEFKLLRTEWRLDEPEESKSE